MGLVTVTFVKIGQLFLKILDLIKHIICRGKFRQTRKLSTHETLLSTVVVQDTNDANGIKEDTSDWGTWNEESATDNRTKLSTVEQHIQQYRMQTSKVEQPPDENFFEGMMPQITQQTKLLIRNETNNSTAPSNLNNNSKLTYKQDSPTTSKNSELMAWEDVDNTGDWEIESEGKMLREKRTLDRERKALEQMKKRYERERKVHIGSKIS